MNETRAQRRDGGADAPIVPVAFDDATAQARDHDPAARGGQNRALIMASAVVLFLATLSVIFVLPRFVGTPSPATAEVGGDAAVPSPAASSNTAAPTTAPRSDTEVAADRLKSQAQLEQILRITAALEERHASTWAADDFATAKASTAAGEQAYREQRYADALTSYSRAIGQLEAIDGRAEAVVTETTSEGYRHIAAGDAGAAERAFELALGIDPDHEPAQRGLARAKTLDQVIALLREAEGYAELGDSNTALARYESALALDAEAPGAADAIARIGQQRADAAFRAAMSAGFAASSDTAARDAFKRALTIRPNAEDARDALAEAENRILAARISAHLSQAAGFVRDERWSEAAKQYEEAAALDADLDGAKASARRAHQRARLNAELESVIAAPHRLQTDAVAEEARALLARARAERDPGARLRGQIERLATTIERARTPVPVTVLSDNATNVTLYKVGSLGRFERREVSVIPGRYVIVGKRDGFRDVRVEFEVSPNRDDSTVTVRCDQKLAFGG